MNEDSQNQKKKRTRRSAEKMAELVLEAERVGASEVCKRENIQPAQLSRWKQKFLQGGIASLKQVKLGPKAKEDPATTENNLVLILNMSKRGGGPGCEFFCHW